MHVVLLPACETGCESSTPNNQVAIEQHAPNLPQVNTTSMRLGPADRPATLPQHAGMAKPAYAKTTKPMSWHLATKLPTKPLAATGNVGKVLRVDRRVLLHMRAWCFTAWRTWGGRGDMQVALLGCVHITAQSCTSN